MYPQLVRLRLQLAASLNISFNEDKEDNLFKIDFWICFKNDGGRLESA